MVHKQVRQSLAAGAVLLATASSYNAGPKALKLQGYAEKKRPSTSQWSKMADWKKA